MMLNVASVAALETHLWNEKLNYHFGLAHTAETSRAAVYVLPVTPIIYPPSFHPGGNTRQNIHSMRISRLKRRMYSILVSGYATEQAS